MELVGQAAMKPQMALARVLEESLSVGMSRGCSGGCWAVMSVLRLTEPAAFYGSKQDRVITIQSNYR